MEEEVIIEVGSKEYFEQAVEKKLKSQPINFERTLWRTLNEMPSIGSYYFIDESLYNSARIRATKEVGAGSEAQEERENKIIELYEEEGGEIERFSIANYPVRATASQIREATFKNRQYRMQVDITALKLESFIIPFFGSYEYYTTRNYSSSAKTYPNFTENYERIVGQIHEGVGLNIDTRLIHRRGGNYYPKVWAAGAQFSTNGYGAHIGDISFLGGSLPILVQSNDPTTEYIAAYGFINPINFNDENEEFDNRVNWSLRREIESFQSGDVEEELLSQLALEASKLLEG